MEEGALARTLYRLARRDVSPSNVGRLLLSDLRTELQHPLTFMDIQQVFKFYYPMMTVERATDNVVLVYFDGKEAVMNLRSMQQKIIPKFQPEFKG